MLEEATQVMKKVEALITAQNICHKGTVQTVVVVARRKKVNTKFSAMEWIR